ncbi:MAG: DUF222 domain-containing protein [Chloroflexi bacterium]|nr:DUF222 domain-containing protein [Chloroflexota bacterium]
MTCVASEAIPTGPGDAVQDAYAQFAASFHRLLVAIGDHDRTEAYRCVGLRREQDYLRRIFDLEWRTARDWVRQARLVATHPEISARFAAGRYSVDKLRATAELVAIAQPETVEPPGPFDDDQRPGGPEPSPDPDPDPEPRPGPAPEPGGADPDPSPRPRSVEALIALMEATSAAQMAARAAQARAEAARRAARWRSRHLELCRLDGEGRLRIGRGELFDDDATVVFAAFADYARRAGSNPASGHKDPLGVRYADALRAMADAYLARRERVVGHPLVVFHAEADHLEGERGSWGAAGPDHSPLGPEVIERLVCGARLNFAIDDKDGNPLFLGRTQRLASWQQEYMAIWRDGACRGCGATVGLQAHHLREWTAEFGLTDIDQLVMLCYGCHHLHHDEGWRLEGDPGAEIRLCDPGGMVRSRTGPDRRFCGRRRPPRAWFADPPAEAPDNAPAESADDDERAPTLW